MCGDGMTLCVMYNEMYEIRGLKFLSRTFEVSGKKRTYYYYYVGESVGGCTESVQLWCVSFGWWVSGG